MVLSDIDIDCDGRLSSGCGGISEGGSIAKRTVDVFTGESGFGTFCPSLLPPIPIPLRIKDWRCSKSAAGSVVENR